MWGDTLKTKKYLHSCRLLHFFNIKKIGIYIKIINLGVQLPHSYQEPIKSDKVSCSFVLVKGYFSPYTKFLLSPVSVVQFFEWLRKSLLYNFCSNWC